MTITKPGDLKSHNENIKLKGNCTKCGCEFTCNGNEANPHKGLKGKFFTCLCPETGCGEGVVLTEVIE